jgi:6-phospho-3-hexuloisomerase
MNSSIRLIVDEIEETFQKSTIDFVPIIELLLSSKRIVCAGAGRVGYAMCGFSMRLKHLGLDSYMIGDSNVPRVKSGDVLVVGSGSGNTPTILSIVQAAARSGCSILLITANSKSQISILSNYVSIINCHFKGDKSSNASNQPMTSLFEQSLSIYLDALVLELMRSTDQKNEDMQERHKNLE